VIASLRILISRISFSVIRVAKDTLDDFSNILLKWFTGISATLVGLGILERFVTPKKYVLSILTNAGSAELIASKNEKLINNIIDRITEIMNNRDVPVSYNFNIAEGNIINQSGSFRTGYSKSGN